MKTKKMIVFTIMMMVLTCRSVWAADIILNEYNAVGSSDYLGDSGSDSYFGRVLGNGGDWFELVVITDHLDIRGWDLIIESLDGNETLTLTSNILWSDLRSGTIITVSEDETEDVSYNPNNGDWWINVRANNVGTGTYIEADNFPVNNDDWTLTIKDDLDSTIFGPAGEGSGQYPGSGINSEEVCFLGDDPSAQITPASDYDESTSSTFSSPNAGQDFSSLRSVIDSDLEIAFADSSFTDPPHDVSGVIDGSTDPAANYGINFTIGHETVSASSLTVEAVSSNTSIVPNDSQHLILSGTDENRTLKVVPIGVGYANIEITVSYGEAELSIDFDYAASAASNTQTSRYHTGMSDASTAVALDGDYKFVANDEGMGINEGPIYLYDRDQSGLPITKFDFTDDLDLEGGGGEVDIEASTRIGSRIFWLGSHGNNKDGECRPNRRRLFATDISGSGVDATLSFVGYYDDLREDLIAWDDDDIHGNGAEYYGFADSAYCAESGGVPPKNENADGFNIEGLTMSPDGDDAYICFRAPISPASARTKGLIVPIVDFETWFNNGSPSGSPTFGSPIELNLGGRGIRSIEKNDADEYLIIAGSYDDTGSPPKDFRLFMWTGNPVTSPVLLAPVLSDLISEGGSIESIVQMPASLLGGDVQFLLDNGTSNWYGNDPPVESKTLRSTFQKYRSDWISIPEKIRLHVSPSGNNTDGLSWTTAYNYLQDVLDDASQAGAYEIWVAEGTYYPDDGDSVTEDDRDETFQLISGVNIYGGFDHGDAWEDRDWKINVTTLSGDIGTAGVNTDNSYHVVTGASSVSLDGFTITKGYANCGVVSWGLYGAGMYNNLVDPVVTNCTFSDNYASYAGGGIFNLGSYNYYGRPAISNCIFDDNTAGAYGGAVHNRNAGSDISNCSFNGNSADNSGGAMSDYLDSDSIVSNCTFSDNTAASYAGAMRIGLSSETTVVNCVFVGNSATTYYGGAIYATQSTSLILLNCTISENFAEGRGGAISMNTISSMDIKNCILWGNTAGTSHNEIHITSGNDPDVSYSDIEGCGGSGGGWNDDFGNDDGGNVDIDPKFEEDDYHLQQPGVATVVNGGTEADYGDKDVDGEDRVMRGTVDMGVDELDWPCEGLQQDGDADGDGTVEFNTSGSGTDDYDKWWVSYNTSTYNVCCDFDRDGDVDWTDRTIGINHNCNTGSSCTNCQGIW